MNPDAVSCLAVIPARGGSKSIPRKNLRLFAGKPLIQWTVEAAVESGCFDAIWVSTDDSEIAETARRAGAEVPFLRPSHLSGDTAATAPVIRHAVDVYIEQGHPCPDVVFVLEPTAPARQPAHIQESLKCMMEAGADSVSAISMIPHHHAPMKQLHRSNEGWIEGLDGVPISKMTHRRQDLETTYGLNGLIWACRSELLFQDPPALWGEKDLGMITDDLYNIDLDHPADWEIGEVRMRAILEEKKNNEV